jgi:hypothetical protein
MTRSSPSPYGRILVAPLQQRRHQQQRPQRALVEALLVLPPLAVTVFAISHLGIPTADAARATHRAVRAFTCIFVAMAVCGSWAILVSNTFEQNHPTLARLVPGHLRALRRALLLAWAAFVVIAGLLPGFFFDAPLVFAAVASLVLVVIAAVLRWPLSWVVVMAIAMLLTRAPAVPGSAQSLLDLWQAQSPAWLVAVLALSAGALCMLLQGGGAGHAAAYVARRDRNRRSRAQLAGTSAANLGVGRLGAIAVAPYFWWLQRQLARPGSSVGSRLLLGMGPSLHWTARLGTIFWTVVGFGGGAALGGLLVPDVGRGVLSGMSLGVLFAIAAPSLQIPARLWQTRGEQALLVLLPGVPRRGALNRWLGLRMTLNFALGLVGGLAASRAMRAMADAIAGGDIIQTMGEYATLAAAALLFLAPLVWRRWHRISAPTGFSAIVPMLALFTLMTALGLLRWRTGVSIAPLAAAGFAVSALWCALRWRQAGAEPEHLPAGRDAR